MAAGFTHRGWFWVVFLAATFALSLCLQGFRTFTLVPDWPNGLRLVGFLDILIVTLLALMYDAYAKEKAKGNIHNRLRLFDWLYERQTARTGGTSPWQ